VSYYNIARSNRVGNSNQSFTGQNPDPMRPLLMPNGGFRTRDVDPNELSSNQLNQITDENGAYIQRARNAGLAQANSRGLLNSSMAAGAAQGAAIDAAMPLAMQQAGAYTNVNDGNMDAENTYLLREGDWRNARDLNRANNTTSLSIAGMDNDERQRQFDEGTRRYDQEYGEGLRRYDEDYRREQETQDRTNTMNRNNFIQSGIFNTVFSNPSIWRDPEAAMGFANYYGTNFGGLWDSIFGGSTPVAP
jgi:hypothetical protein